MFEVNLEFLLLALQIQHLLLQIEDLGIIEGSLASPTDLTCYTPS